MIKHIMLIVCCGAAHATCPPVDTCPWQTIEPPDLNTTAVIRTAHHQINQSFCPTHTGVTRHTRAPATFANVHEYLEYHEARARVNIWWSRDTQSETVARARTRR